MTRLTTDRTLRRKLLAWAPSLLALSPLAALTPRPAAAHGDTHGRSSTAASPPEQQAWGIAAGPRQRARRLVIRMDDAMRFSPTHLDVTEGETLELVIHNHGKLMHELVIGTREELDKHAKLMLEHPGMEHDEPWMAHVPPGKTGRLRWTFNRVGQFEFACLIAGHFQAGMRGTVSVRAAAGSSKRPPSPT